ncbi:hypothetical protein BP6252_11917 [Coleophoma cylindrospora]|uniref:Transcription factor domain-containing protein n=1 Tax=Coleophoma cylindrospora TaxID=1849047 RepID=A0A3D8QGJ2_9HELO|nr:hypothetical protein BP6252_11917 [Coleophoma cylindrospora]
MHDDVAIRNADQLLASGLSSEGDRGFVAQVKLFRILARCYFMYGCDADLELGGQDFEILQSLNISLDQWRLEHQPKGTDSASFTKSNHSLLPSFSNSAELSISERQEAANNAIAAATSTVRLMIEDSDLRSAQIGMPLFVHAIVAVCASFLLKMAVVFSESNTTNRNTLSLPGDLSKYGLTIHTKNILTEAERLVRMLNEVADNAGQQHVARHVVTGLRELLGNFSAGSEMNSFVYSRSSAMPSPLESGVANQSVRTGYDAYAMEQADNPRFNQSCLNIPAAQGNKTAQPASHEQQQDPFDLLGDLDWRFNDAFLLNIQAAERYM